jgi:hypothetical protein
VEDDRRDLQQGAAERRQHRGTRLNPGESRQEHANPAGEVQGPGEVQELGGNLTRPDPHLRQLVDRHEQLHASEQSEKREDDDLSGPKPRLSGVLAAGPDESVVVVI